MTRSAELYTIDSIKQSQNASCVRKRYFYALFFILQPFIFHLLALKANLVIL